MFLPKFTAPLIFFILVNNKSTLTICLCQKPRIHPIPLFFFTSQSNPSGNLGSSALELSPELCLFSCQPPLWSKPPSFLRWILVSLCFHLCPLWQLVWSFYSKIPIVLHPCSKPYNDCPYHQNKIHSPWHDSEGSAWIDPIIFSLIQSPTIPPLTHSVPVTLSLLYLEFTRHISTQGLCTSSRYFTWPSHFLRVSNIILSETFPSHTI